MFAKRIASFAMLVLLAFAVAVQAGEKESGKGKIAKAAEAQLAVLKDTAAPIERRRQILTAFARDAYAAALPVVL